MTCFGDQLREFRRHAGLTQEQLAERAAISSQAVGALERGSRRFPHQHTLARLADALGLDDAQRAAFAVAAARPSRPPAVRPTETRADPVRTPRQLPPAAVLVGREAMITDLADFLGSTERAVGHTALLVGPGGIGKSALAIAAGHRLARVFPDGQLFIDLRGAQPDPADPYAVLGRVLRALGVPRSEVPADRDERLAAYRSVLADRRLLLVLDDAAAEEQLRPLLPPVGCATIVTSRRQLGALVGASRWTVPVLGRDDAVRLLARIAGDDRIAGEPGAASHVVEACGRSPLAICVAAGRLAVRRHWSVAELGRRLTAQHGRLDVLSFGDLDVRASIGLSYQALPPEQRRLFRRLGTLWLPDWPAWVADALCAGQAEPQLEELVNVHLVEAIGVDGAGQQRFRLHDLIAAFARERANAEEHPDVLGRITADLLRSWLAVAAEADEELAHGYEYGAGLCTEPAPARPAAVARRAPAEWFEAERAALVTGVSHAVRTGRTELAGMLALRQAGFLRVRGHRDDQLSTLRQALAAVRRTGPDDLRLRLAETLLSALLDHDLDDEMPALIGEVLLLARALDQPNLLVRALLKAGLYAKRRGRLPEAIGHCEQALATCDDSSPLMLSTALASLAMAYTEAGRPREALPLAERAVAIQRLVGAPVMTALRLLTYAEVLAELGRCAAAETALEEAVALSRAAGHEAARAYADLRLGEVAISCRRWEPAAGLIRAAATTFERQRDTGSAAYALRAAGDLALAEGRPGAAVAPYQRALDTWRRLRLPLEVARAEARLDRTWSALGEECRAAEHRAACERILADLGLDERALRLGGTVRAAIV
jgi:transcriptional regulator with XRE-family HTH domain/tetratricopeptide (TPR) repeat protein